MTSPDDKADAILEPTAFGRAWSVPKRYLERWWTTLDEWQRILMSWLERPKFEAAETFPEHIASFLLWAASLPLILAAAFVLQVMRLMGVFVLIVLTLFAMIYIVPFVFIVRGARFLFRRVAAPAPLADPSGDRFIAAPDTPRAVSSAGSAANEPPALEPPRP